MTATRAVIGWFGAVSQLASTVRRSVVARKSAGVFDHRGQVDATHTDEHGANIQLVAKLRDIYIKAVADPALRTKLVEAGIEPLQSTPQEMADYIKAETAKWSRVIKDANITLD